MAEFDNQELDYEILVDESESGKDRKWKERKLSNIELAKDLETLGYKVFSRVYQCAEVMKFKKQHNGRLKLYQTWFCKNKLCPICNWRRALKHSYQSAKIIEEALELYPSARFIFVTLTVKNVPGEELNQTLTEMSKAFNRLILRKKFKKNVLGFLRATEVTYNKRRDDYHPHLHVLLMVRSTYFKNKANYITHQEWTEYWEKSAKLGYTPVVNVKAVKPRDNLEDGDIALKKAILETAKYPVKPFDIDVDKNGNKTKLSRKKKLKVTDDMAKALYRKRQIAYGGLFKELKKKLGLDDVEEGDLVNTSDDEKISESAIDVIAQWDWQRKNYFIKS